MNESSAFPGPGWKELPWSYWPRLAMGDIQWFGSRRRWAALARSMWRVLHGDNGERCGTCGRDYVLWMALDDLFLTVHGSLGGQHCPTCFSTEAEAKGIVLCWEPHPVPKGPHGLNVVASQVGAFQ